MTVHKYSKQREAIKNFLSSTTCHPTADEVYVKVREEQPNISLGTVYRNLSSMSESGEIRKISCKGAPDRFDARIEEHGHFICRKCGRVYDVFLDMEKVKNVSGDLIPGSIENCDLMYYGICSACKEK